MSLSKRLLLVLGILLVAILIPVAWVSSVCQQMTKAPSAPVYPGAILIAKDATLGDYPHADEYYTSTDSPKKVVEFYTAHAACYKIDQGTGCTANANPFGRYTVYIYIHEQFYPFRYETAFHIYFVWSPCIGIDDWFK